MAGPLSSNAELNNAVAALLGLTSSASIAGGTFYLALFTGAGPGQTGASNEVTGGSYARQLVALGLNGAVAGQVYNTSATAVQFTGMPGVTITYYGVFSALTAGTYYAGGVINSGSGQVVQVGSTVSFAQYQLTLSVAQSQ